MTDSTLRNLLIAWAMGFAFALVLVERWRRMGMAAAGVVPAALEEPPAEHGETKPSPIARVRQIGIHAGESVAHGVKADVERIRDSFHRSPRQNEQVDQVDAELTAAAP